MNTFWTWVESGGRGIQWDEAHGPSRKAAITRSSSIRHIIHRRDKCDRRGSVVAPVSCVPPVSHVRTVATGYIVRHEQLITLRRAQVAPSPHFRGEVSRQYEDSLSVQLWDTSRVKYSLCVTGGTVVSSLVPTINQASATLRNLLVQT